jgi:uncharacterized membrane protein
MTPQDQQQQNIQSVGGNSVREQDKIMLVLAYLGILALIPFLTVKDSEYVKWHAKQGLVLGVASFVFFILLVPMQFIPILGQIIGCLSPIALLVVVIMAISKALKGERWALPVISDLANKF